MSFVITWNGWFIALYVYAICLIFFFGSVYEKFSTRKQFGLFAIAQIAFCVAQFQLGSGFFYYIVPAVVIIDTICKYFLVILPSIYLFKNYLHKWFITFVLPIMWIGYEQIWSLTPILNMTSVTLSQVENTLTLYLTSYFGGIFLSWPAFWMASVTYLCHKYPQHWKWQKIFIFPIAIILLLMTLPGTELRHYYQTTYSNTNPNISAACMHDILGSGIESMGNSDALTNAFQSKLDLIVFPERRGDQTVENFLLIYKNETNEEMKKKMFPPDENYKPIIAYGFTEYNSRNALMVRQFSYVNGKNEIEVQDLYQYDKLNMVPGENSRQTLKSPYPDSFPLGKFRTNTSGAICYDYSNPETIRRLSFPGVDLMLNISHTWASFVTGIAKENKFRGIENGFWMLKCDSAGKVVYTNPFGDVYYRYGPELKNKDSLYVRFDIENPKGVFTFYKYGGFVFPWICLSIFFLVNIYNIYCACSKKKKNVDPIMEAYQEHEEEQEI
jgi:hypothetical protein